MSQRTDNSGCPKGCPNVVFIITDDQGYGDLGCTGNPIVRTPNIDKLYNECTRFTDFHVGPTCAPTRAGLMTGHFHNSTGVWHTIGGRSLLRKGETSMADIFRDGGYRTGIFGKWHLGDNYPYRPHDRGFEEAIVHGGGGIGQTPDYWGNDYFDDTYFKNGQPVRYDGYCTDVWFDLATDFIERHQKEPFFCYIPTNAPHGPFNIAPEYVKPYDGVVPPNRAKFYGMIANIDENVGKLRARLDELGLTENTIFIFMTDNGTSGGCSTDKQGFLLNGYNAGMRGVKCSPYEGGHRVPFFIYWPAGKLNYAREINELAANVDFLPTLMDLCGISKREGLDFDGTSLKPLLYGEETPAIEKIRNRILVTDNQRVPNPVKWKDSCAMTGKWRLIGKTELYDLLSDPEERTNLSEKYPNLTERLQKGYEQWWDLVSRQFGEEIPISIGSDNEEVTDLTSHDCRGDVAEVAFNQGEIREGKICNSYWEINVEHDGIYEFELRRWPIEEDRAICEGIQGEILDWYTGGRAIPIKSACLSICGVECEKPVADGEKYAFFQVKLKSGPAHLYAYFTDADGCVINAYYTYVRYQVPPEFCRILSNG